MDTELSTSIVIPTYNGSAKVARLLESLLRQTKAPGEVVVVVDGSTDGTAEALMPWRGLLPLQIVEQPNTGRAAARNAGVQSSAGELLIFFDDDVTLPPDCLQKHVAFHATREGLLTGNPQETPGPDKSDLQNYKGMLVKRWVEKYNPGLNRLSDNQVFFTGANCSVRRSVFDRLNGFDAALRDIEDQDFAQRAIDKGVPVWFDLSNTVEHHDEITCVRYIRRLREYATWHRVLAERYPLRTHRGARSAGWKRLVYRMFASRGWAVSVDQSSLWQVLPRPVRYRLYEVIIHALSVEFPDIVL